MSEDLKFLVRRINVRIRAKDPTVIEDAVKLTAQYPEESEAWEVLAHAYTRMEDNYSAAITALTRAIENKPKRFVLFLHRGEYERKIRDYDRAIADFSQALVLCDEQKVDWCRRELHFLRAEALIQLGKKAEALADLAHVPDDYEFPISELESKAEALALCADAISPGNDGRYNGPPDSTSKEEKEAQETFDKWQLPETPDADEAALAEQLGAAGLAKADATLLKWVPRRYGKVARVLCEAIEADDFEVTDTLVCVYLRRLIALVDAGAIEGAGNVRRPRWSEVRLPESQPVTG